MRTVLFLIAAAVVIALVFGYTMPSNNPVEQQPSPHAIDQDGQQ
jgi:hypothetical protein